MVYFVELGHVAYAQPVTFRVPYRHISDDHFIDYTRHACQDSQPRMQM